MTEMDHTWVNWYHEEGTLLSKVKKHKKKNFFTSLLSLGTLFLQPSKTIWIIFDHPAQTWHYKTQSDDLHIWLKIFILFKDLLINALEITSKISMFVVLEIKSFFQHPRKKIQFNNFPKQFTHLNLCEMVHDNDINMAIWKPIFQNFYTVNPCCI